MVGLVGSDELGGETWLVGGVGASLAFYSYGAIIGIDGTVFAGRTSSHPVASVDLHCGLVGGDGEFTAGFRIGKGGYLRDAAVIGVGKPTVVISLSEAYCVEYGDQ